MGITAKVLKESKTGKGKVILYENGIMHQMYDDAISLNIKDSRKEIGIYRTEYCREEKRPILVDITNIKSVTKESRGIYSSDETAGLLKGAALLVGNPVSRIVGNFYLGLNKTAMPVRLFTDINEAWNWLEQLLT